MRLLGASPSLVPEFFDGQMSPDVATMLKKFRKQVHFSLEWLWMLAVGARRTSIVICMLYIGLQVLCVVYVVNLCSRLCNHCIKLLNLWDMLHNHLSCRRSWRASVSYPMWQGTRGTTAATTTRAGPSEWPSPSSCATTSDQFVVWAVRNGIRSPFCLSARRVPSRVD